jgi:tetratricopeptide (TPR) repeat protein
MGDRSPDRMKALGRAALALLIEAVKELVPAFGPIQAAWEAYHDALRPEDLPDRVREMLQNMRQDYRQLLEPELRAQAGETVAIALREAIGILDERGLSPEELAAEAGLDPQEAARRTRERAAHRLERLDERARSLAERMIEDYYRVLLNHRDALAYVGIPALQELLRRTEGLAARLLAALDLQRWREAWAALLPVVRLLPGPLTPENLLEALRAPYRLVEFTGKAHRALGEEIAGALKGPGSHPSRAWVLWGPGGAGKTRTAVEIGRALEAEGWRAGFVPSFPLAVWAPHLPFWSRPDRPTLLIVDYAEQRPADDLRALAGAVGEAASKRSAPLALLFLMRADPREAVAGHVADALAEARIRWEARRVPPVEDPEDRQALFRKARARFREALAPPDAPPEVDYEPEDLPRTPLALLALAVLAAHGHRVVQSQDEAAILTDLWKRWEQPRWKRTLEVHGGRELLQTPEVWDEARARIEQALAAASLGRPFTAPEEVAAWWEDHFPFRARTAEGKRLDPSWLARRLKVLFPAVGEAWRLPPISPDPLADVALARFGPDLGRLVDSILPAPEAVKAEEIVAVDWPARMVVEALPRLSVAAVPGASEAARAALEAVARWLGRIVRVLPNEVAAAWFRIWFRMWEEKLPRPDHTLALRPFLADFYRIRLERMPREEPQERARLAHMLGFALSALGRREEALEATQEAVALYRRLAAQHPDAFLPDLARSLNSLGVDLSALGRREEALEATQEAVALYRRLAVQHPDAFLPDLAMSLNNLGSMLSEMGRRAEALQATQEAVALYRRLAAQHPDAFLPDLARSLNSLGVDLSALGRRAEALQATQEAVEIYRRLAAQHPDAFLPYLARSLNNLGAMLSEMGRRAEALQATQEAVEIYRRLAAQHPDAFLPDLAASLHNLGNRLSEIGRRAEALQATQEAVDLYRRLAAQHPDAFLPDLARSLNNLGNRLSEMGRWEEALQATQEAVEIRRRLAAQHPDAFLPYLARSLGAHGLVLRGLGRSAEAAAAFAEGLRAILPFVRALPAAFGGLAGALLQDYLRACAEAGEAPDEALVAQARRAIG